MKPSKILVIQSGNLGPLGEQIYSITSKRQIEFLQNKGFDFKVFIIQNRQSLTGLIQNIVALKGHLKKNSYSIIHAHFGSIVSFITMLCLPKKNPFIVSVCGSDLLGNYDSGFKSQIRSTLSRWMTLFSLIKATHVVCKSSNLKSKIPKRFHHKISLIPNGIDTEYFKPILNKKKLKESLGWDGSQFQILFNGGTMKSLNDMNVKNYPLARRAFEIFNQNCPESNMNVAMNLKPDKFLHWLQASDCVLLTSFHEGSPNLVKEALSCNIPVVSVPCGDVIERLNEVNIGGCTTYSPKDLAHQLEKVYKALVKFNGRGVIFNQKLDQNEMVKKWVKIYNSSLT